MPQNCCPPNNDPSFSSLSTTQQQLLLQQQQQQQQQKQHSQNFSRKRPRADHNISRRNARLATQIQATPWIHLAELESTGRDLLTATTLHTRQQDTIKKESTSNANDDDARTAGSATETTTTRMMALAQALERVEIWKLRSQRLPQAIEATHALATCLFTECQYDYSTTMIAFSNTTTLLSLSYASAILRCINGLTDVLQQSRASAASVAVLSQQLGIPAWLVDTRHQSTHNQLPSLSILRTAAITLLQYLEQVYWIPLSQQRRDWYHLATILLQDYERAATAIATADNRTQQQQRSKNSAGAPPNPNSVARIAEKSTTKEETDDDGEESDGGEGYNHSYLGTSFNRFAVLQEDSKKKKKLKKEVGDVDAAATTSTVKGQSPKVIMHAEAPAVTPWSAARKFARSPDIPVDVIYETALSFFLTYATKATPSTSPGNGTNTTASTVTLCPQRSIRQLYVPLLMNLTQIYPGFASALLVRLVDFACCCDRPGKTIVRDDGSAGATDDSDSAPTPEYPHKEVALDMMRTTMTRTTCWIEYLLSDEWLHLMLDSGDSVQYSQHDYPLRALYNRCMKADSEVARAVAGQLLRKRWRQGEPNDDAIPLTLKDGRNSVECPITAPEASTAWNSVAEQQSSVEEEHRPAVLHSDAETANKQAMTLEEMEAMLLAENNTTCMESAEQYSTRLHSMMLPLPSPIASDIANASSKPCTPSFPEKEAKHESQQRAAWVLCATWDPCTIGTLPGYPG